MKRVIVLMLLILSPLVGVVVEANSEYTAVDNEMIELLQLDASQVPGYLQIIQQQREHFLTLDPANWQQELALYQDTFILLESVLSAEQHALFVGAVNSTIETPPEPQP